MEDKIESILNSPRFQRDLQNAPSLMRRRRRVDWHEVGCLAVIMFTAFVAGVVFIIRLTDGSPA